MISLAVEVASKNVSEGSGGPFGCAIFERDVKTGKAKLFTLGTFNVVTNSDPIVIIGGFLARVHFERTTGNAGVYSVPIFTKRINQIWRLHVFFLIVHNIC